MRLAFFLLLLINLILLAWGQGMFGGGQQEREPERLGRQIDADKLQILSPAAAPPAAPAAPRPLACKRIAWLTLAEANALREALAPLPDWQLKQATRKEEPIHWVVIAGLANRALAEKKKGELAQLGVKEGEIVEDAQFGPFAVSLGVFRSQALADELLQSVGKKGVRSAQLIKRDSLGEKYAFDLQAPADLLSAKLVQLMAALPQASLTDCPAER